MSEIIQGIIERVIFHNPENGFSVLRVSVEGHVDLATVVGNVPSISVSDHIECQGEWRHDKAYGRQFKADHLKSIPPKTLEGMEKYLGLKTAKALMQALGSEAFSILEQEPERFLACKGIGKKRKKEIMTSWNAQKSARDIMSYLQSHGLSSARAVRIYKMYGDDAVLKVSENPYRLISDVQGIGFKVADDLALHLGLPSDSSYRAAAGVHHVLQGWCHLGHCAIAYQTLIEASVDLLEISREIIQAAIDQEVLAARLVSEKINDVDCIFPVDLHQAELKAAEQLLRIQAGSLPWGEIDASKIIPWVATKTGLQLAESQRQAIEVVLKHKLAIITGGPGVGKTTIVNSLLKIFQSKSLSVALCAPTGRAAKRLMETTGLTAKTIHRLLGINPETRSFKHDQDHPLSMDVLVVDEASMMDTVLFHHLLNAIPDHAALLFVGDVDQLPSVGSGAVLMDMIRSLRIPTVRLTEIFRQAVNSNIIFNAHRINQGELPLPNESAESDFYTIYEATPELIHETLMAVVSKRLPAYVDCDPITDIQVLTPMNQGQLGSIALNNALQKKLNGDAEPKIARSGFVFAPGDKVIQVINNYEKEVFNGDIGFIAQIDLDKQLVQVSYDNRFVAYDYNELDELSLAYAISIHKSQGSEFPVVVMVLSTQHYRLLARNLLYTGVTRGKSMVVLITDKKAVRIAVNNNRENERLTKLAERLTEVVA